MTILWNPNIRSVLQQAFCQWEVKCINANLGLLYLLQAKPKHFESVQQQWAPEFFLAQNLAIYPIQGHGRAGANPNSYRASTHQM